MSAPVDVLAVMEQDAQTARLWREARIDNNFVLAANAEQSREARAAVAELIAVNAEVLPMLEMALFVGGRDPEPGSIGHRYRTALARVQGRIA